MLNDATQDVVKQMEKLSNEQATVKRVDTEELAYHVNLYFR